MNRCHQATGRAVFFQVIANTVVCSNHFFVSALVASAKKPYCRLRRDAGPTVFSFRKPSSSRPSPSKRAIDGVRRLTDASLKKVETGKTFYAPDAEMSHNIVVVP